MFLWPFLFFLLFFVVEEGVGGKGLRALWFHCLQ